MSKFYRVHVHDQNDQGRWLASADFRKRPFQHEIPPWLPVLFEPGRYEVRVNVVHDGEEYGLAGWLQDQAPVPVIFRQWRAKRDQFFGDGIIALFPYEPADNAGLLCQAYEHMGQHGGATLSLVMERTRPASPEQYAALKRELESAPYTYRLAPIQRTPKDASDVRYALARAAGNFRVTGTFTDDRRTSWTARSATRSTATTPTGTSASRMSTAPRAAPAAPTLTAAIACALNSTWPTPSITRRQDMPTIANMPGADLDVTFASGQTRTVNMIRLLVQTRNAECKARFGYFLPGVGKQHPTIAALRQDYELDYFYDAPVRTWKDAALVMRHFYDLCRQHISDR